MIVRTFDGLKAMTAPLMTSGGGQIALYGSSQAYATLYARQPNVRTCVDFLSRNIAQVPLHAFRRVSDTDRQRLSNHDLVRWVGDPNPATRAYRLTEALVGDLGIYLNAFLLKVPSVEADGRPRIGLVRLPPEQMSIEGGLLPSNFKWTTSRGVADFAPGDVCYFGGYNPLDPLKGLSPLETLRTRLAEEQAAGEHREAYWRNAARMDGVIERPINAPRWTPIQKTSFREQLKEFTQGGVRAGSTLVLEDGMTYKGAAFSARESEYLLARKLTREECAAAYHIPLPMVGILDHATFSNIKEQHKQLYQDTLGPWLEMLVQEWAAQLLIECEDQANVYLEYNIADKLKGSFEEQATSLNLLVGRPIMTADEGRARLNLPSLADQDPSAGQLAEQQGGPATAAVPRDAPSSGAVAVVDIVEGHRARHTARLARVPIEARADAFTAHLNRWNRELTTDLTPLLGAEHAGRMAATWNTETRMRLELEAMTYAA